MRFILKDIEISASQNKFNKKLKQRAKYIQRLQVVVASPGGELPLNWSQSSTFHRYVEEDILKGTVSERVRDQSPALLTSHLPIQAHFRKNAGMSALWCSDRWAHSRVDKVPGNCVNACGHGQVWQLVLGVGPYWLTATSMTPCCYISHVDAISKQNKLSSSPKDIHIHTVQHAGSYFWAIWLLPGKKHGLFEATQTFNKVWFPTAS